MFKNADSFEICNVIMICKAAEIILTLSATFKASADQQSVDVKTDFTFLGHDDLFSQIYMTPPEGQTQVIARAQSISLIHCLFRLVKCKFTEPHYKSAWYTLLSLLIFSTYALSIKREGRNLTKKKKKGNIAVAAVVAFLCGYALKSAVLRYCGYRDSPICRFWLIVMDVKISSELHQCYPLKWFSSRFFLFFICHIHNYIENI